MLGYISGVSYKKIPKLENIFKVSINYKNIRIKTLRKYRKEIVHNTKKQNIIPTIIEISTV